MGKNLEETFLSAIEQHQHKLLRICSVYAKDEDDKKDLFQEALINIWQSMEGFEGRSTMGTWMYRVTLNVCLRLLVGGNNIPVKKHLQRQSPGKEREKNQILKQFPRKDFVGEVQG
ncbi:MAG: RNA polymerase sigma factor [Cyclobacteriaceae bacterium]|nr:RNA polymerase sigma factor [Cyclobacteriaceae bacterium]